MSRASLFGFVGFVFGSLVACSGASPEGALGGSPAACGNGALDPGETCDTGIASGAQACPASCDDGDPCTEDRLDGAACTAHCSHDPVPGCASTCGNAAVDPGEACDVAIPPGQRGACPSTCAQPNACTKQVLTGTGCNARCQTETVTARISGDGCCPSGATHANDADCPARYGEVCTADADCTTKICHVTPYCGAQGCTCTMECDPQAPLSTCGGAGRFCATPYVGKPVCTFIVDTDLDGDDRVIGVGSPLSGKINSAKDVDVFVLDAAVGTWKIELVPTDASPAIDLAFDVYGGNGTLGFTMNEKGMAAAETAVTNVPAAQRMFVAVRTSNTHAGNYRISVTAN